jgi:hypothetical protein
MRLLTRRVWLRATYDDLILGGRECISDLILRGRESGVSKDGSNKNANTASRSRGPKCPRFGLFVPPSSNRGRGECRAPDAPDSRVCKGSEKTHTR